MQKYSDLAIDLKTNGSLLSLPFFFDEVFSESVKTFEGKFIPGTHFREWCARLQNYLRTATKSARLHGKTLTVYAKIMWHLFRLSKRRFEILLLGYKEDAAAYHLKKVNDYIRVNSFFKDFKKIGTAETIVHYAYGNKEFIVEPAGILSFKRGRHPDIVICDDILKDPENLLNISQIIKINETFKKEVYSLPKKDGGELHVFGTPQDPQDLFAQLEKDKLFDARDYPAILNEALKTILWPEGFTYEYLMQLLESLGIRVFGAEYMCRPARSAKSYIDAEKLGLRINKTLVNLDYRINRQTQYDVYAGHDIGKAVHPSHLSIFEKVGDKMIQLHQHFFDHVDYIDQVAYLNEAIKNFKVTKLLYDNTRGEFMSQEEEGKLASEMMGMVLSSKNRFAAASAFQSAISKTQNKENKSTISEIELLNDDRQTRQILNCDEDLQSVSSADGHGDSFWSIVLAIKAANMPIPGVIIL